MTPERASTGQSLLDAGSSRALKRQKREAGAQRSEKLNFGTLLYWALALTGWFATTLLAAAGCFVVLFMMAGNGSLGGFFEQVGLLSQHYLVALPVARGSFDAKMLMAIGSVVLLTGFFRRSALISIFRTGGRNGQ
jgi:hypothetical protein